MTAVAITIFTIGIVLVLDRLENRYIKSLLDWFPAILFAYVIPAFITRMMGVDLSGDEIHQFSKNWLIPLAIVSVMSTLSIAQLKAIGWKPIFLFVSGSFAIAVLPVIMIFVLQGSEFVTEIISAKNYWKGIPPIVGSWIGGSTSQLVLKELVNCPEDVFLNILVLDNILVNVWTVLMFQFIKKSKKIDEIMSLPPVQAKELKEITIENPLPLWIGIVSLVCCVALVNHFTDVLVTKVIVLSIIGLAMSNLIPRWPIRNMLKVGSILIIAVMAVLGLKLQIDRIEVSGGFLGFLVIWLLLHFIVMLIIARRIGISSAWVPIASMANVGGIATAPAVTAAYEKKWMPHAILLAILSMATGTFWGMLTIFLLQRLLI